MSMHSIDHIKHYLPVSGVKFGMNDYEIMKKYEGQMTNGQCVIGCNECEAVCPNSVPVNDIMRYRLYFEGYGIQKVAIQEYGKLNSRQKSDQCKGCNAVCESRCPNKVAIKDHLTEAHQILTV